ncbi:hypothetical protein ACIPRD_09270 [Streptomyces sp. NPDC090108]|uniref:hypothetical protein n=1 Tax=Streptomyces sp. NPDC090108 TaxID=3365947 RepID=UPI00382CBD8D
MSNSSAAAVLTTADLDEAMRAVRTLLDIADLDCAEVDFEARIASPDTLARVLGVLPDLEWWALSGGERGSSKDGDDPVRCLPVRVHDWSRPLDRAEPFVAALGADSAAVRWDLNAWPEVPGAGLEMVSEKYAYLTLTVNSRDLYQDEPSRDHTVHVHVPWAENCPDRINWLAEQVGGRFTGRVEMAPL